MMISCLLYVAVLCVTSTLTDPIDEADKVDIKVLQDRQLEVQQLFSHILEPTYIKKFQAIASSWTLEKNINAYRNVTAASQYAIMIKNKWILRRMVPYAVYDPAHNMETITAFNVLYSAKTYDDFFKTAVYLRENINEYLFVYIVSVAILHRNDTQELTIPPIYKTFPNFFVSPNVIFTAMYIDVQGKEFVDKYEGYKNLTFVKDDVVYIKEDAFRWAYTKNKLNDISYFTHDLSLNAMHYYYSLKYPYWLSYDVLVSLNEDRRGEIWLYDLRQLVARYNMESLCNGLSEIPALSDEITEGYISDLMYANGVPFPCRPDNFHLNHKKLANMLEAAKEFEHRIWEAIDKGFYYNSSGKLVSLRNEDGADVLGRLIQAYADSPNSCFYKDFFRIYASVIGNTVYDSIEPDDGFAPLIVPSVIENYQTALRDPAYYIIAQRIVNLFNYWNKKMKLYTPEELSVSGVKIVKVETNKLVTFIENTYLNLSNALPMTPNERKQGYDSKSVATAHPRLNYKIFSAKMIVKSDARKKIRVNFYLSDKSSSRHYTDNIYQFDDFTIELQTGDNVIIRASNDDGEWITETWYNDAELNKKVDSGKSMPNLSQKIFRFPQNLLFPKGSINGMTFQLMVFIDDIPLKNSTNSDKLSDKPYGYPTNRPLFMRQLKDVKNIYFQDFVIYHEPTQV